MTDFIFEIIYYLLAPLCALSLGLISWANGQSRDRVTTTANLPAAIGYGVAASLVLALYLWFILGDFPFTLGIAGTSLIMVVTFVVTYRKDIAKMMGGGS